MWRLSGGGGVPVYRQDDYLPQVSLVNDVSQSKWEWPGHTTTDYPSGRKIHEPGPRTVGGAIQTNSR